MCVIRVIQEIFGFDYSRYEYITINNKVQASNKCQVRHVDSIMSTRGSHNIVIVSRLLEHDEFSYYIYIFV